MYIHTVYTYIPMANYQWYLDEKRLNLLKEGELLPEAKSGIAKLLEIALEEYIKNHKEGNPTYKLDVWTENPEFIAIPALLADKEKRNAWIAIQAKRKNWQDLKDIKFTLQEWQAQLKRYGL